MVVTWWNADFCIVCPDNNALPMERKQYSRLSPPISCPLLGSLRLTKKAGRSYMDTEYDG